MNRACNPFGSFFGHLENCTHSGNATSRHAITEKSFLSTTPGMPIPYPVLFVAALLLYFVSAAMHGELLPCCFSFVQYILMLPTYINMLCIYAYCNLVSSQRMRLCSVLTELIRCDRACNYPPARFEVRGFPVHSVLAPYISTRFLTQMI